MQKPRPVPGRRETLFLRGRCFRLDRFSNRLGEVWTKVLDEASHPLADPSASYAGLVETVEAEEHAHGHVRVVWGEEVLDGRGFRASLPDLADLFELVLRGLAVLEDVESMFEPTHDTRESDHQQGGLLVEQMRDGWISERCFAVEAREVGLHDGAPGADILVPQPVPERLQALVAELRFEGEPHGKEHPLQSIPVL